jgi:hypothetical protein
MHVITSRSGETGEEKQVASPGMRQVAPPIAQVQRE